MTETEAIKLFKALSDKSRLQILKSLAMEDMYVERLAQRDAAYRQKVIDSFFEYGKLKSIPAQRKKERIILEVIAEKFEPDHIYSEREVNLIIADFHDDFCTIRRDMIGKKLLDRDRNGYWKVK